MTTGKIIALTRQTFVSKVKSLLLSGIVRKLIPIFKPLNLRYFVIAAQLKLFTTDWVLNPCAGTQPQPKPCLELKPTWLRLKPSQNPWYLVSRPNEALVLDVSSQKEFSKRQSDRLRSRFIQIQREAHSTDRVWAIAEGECSFKMWCV